MIPTFLQRGETGSTLVSPVLLITDGRHVTDWRRSWDDDAGITQRRASSLFNKGWSRQEAAAALKASAHRKRPLLAFPRCAFAKSRAKEGLRVTLESN